MSDLYQKIYASFVKQGLMQTLGATLDNVEPGMVQISCDFHVGLSQQHGFFHAGVLTSIVDSACGYAALTLAPEGNEVLSVEFKINLMRPANCPKIITIGKVIHAGRTLTICEGNVYDETQSKLLARMTATMMGVQG